VIPDSFASGPLTFKRFFSFWSPLAVTWVLMAAEGPFLAAVIARLADAKVNLAAFGVAFGLAILIESPIIMLLSASNALVRDRQSYRQLRLFAYGLSGAITVIMVLFTQTPLYWFVTMDLMDLPPEVARLAWGGMTLLIPWPGVIGLRRFYQGILIKAGLTDRVAWGTVVRLASIAVAGVLLYTFSDWPGVYVGDLAMSIGVTAEAIFSGVAAQGTIKAICSDATPPAPKPLTMASINQFYYPLALTSLVSFMTMSITSFFVAHARESMNSLAVLPVIHSTLYLFSGVSVSLQEVSVAMVGKQVEWVPALRRHGYLVAGISTLLFYTVLLTPLRELWFGTLGGLSQELTNFTLVPALIMGAQIMLTAWMSIQRGILVVARSTGAVRDATIIEVVCIVSLLWLTLQHFGWIGAVGASFAAISGRAIGNFYLVSHTGRALTRLRSTEN